MALSITLQVPSFDSESVRHAVRYYKKMAYHRSVVLEGVRRCAMRNRNYWYETVEELVSETARSPKVADVLDRIKIRQEENAERELRTIAPISDELRRESGLEVPEEGFPFSRAHDLRRLFESRLTIQILHSIWDVYLSLLYVELEGYVVHARTTPELSCPIIGTFIQNNRAFVDWLKSFRDKLLHPISDTTSADLAEDFVRATGGASSSEPYQVFTLQRMLDCHLVVVREGIARIRGRAWVSSQLGVTPPDTNAMSRDQFVGLDTYGSAPNISILLCACLVSKVMTSGRSSTSSPMASLSESVRSGLSNMLFRSLLLISERIGTVDVVKLLESANPDTLSLSQIAELSRDGSAPRTLQEFNNLLSLDRVAVALLHEPLRIYFDVARSTGAHNPSSISTRVPKGKDYSALKAFRNVVFHVAPGRRDSDRIESRWIGIEKMYPSVELLTELQSFFGYSHFCPLDSVWAFGLRASAMSRKLP